MKIAVGTDDGKTIRKGHFGSSRYYRIVEILNGEIASKELRRNSYVEAENATRHHGQSRQILDLLKDCSLFIAGSMGKNPPLKLRLSTLTVLLLYLKQLISQFQSICRGKTKASNFMMQIQKNLFHVWKEKIR
jgi:predicted Fe-Mo cluster-binding NifX family protein